MHNILWDFAIQTDYLISAERLDIMIVNKKEKKKADLPNCALCRIGRPMGENKRGRKKKKSNT